MANETPERNYQNLILSQGRKDKMPVTVFLVSGVQIKGVIKNFDSYVVVLEVDGKEQMIYKHAISTIIPLKAIKLEATK